MVKAATFLVTTAIATCFFSNPVYMHEEPTRRALSTDQRKLFAQNAQAAVTECNKSKSSRKLQERAVARRTETVENLRRKLNQRRLDAATVSALDHQSNLTVTTKTPSTDLFKNQTTVLVEPEVTQGPYYIKGEYIRTDMTEDQKGVPMYIDVQVIDVSTCNPVKDMYVDLWHANATGVYSGVAANSNGNAADTTNLEKTFLRGVNPTDSDGVAEMTSIFPGHYEGRATHLHFVGNYGGKVLSNETYSGGSVVHVGQFFFDKKLMDKVEAVAPYSTNNQSVTANADDMWLKAAALTGYDPIMNYAWLSTTVNDGVFVWISLAVDLTAERTVEAVSTLTGTPATSGSSSGSSMNTTTTNTNSALSKCGGFSTVAVVLLAAITQIFL